MSKSTNLKCDCGCRKKTKDTSQCGWFTLSQLPYDKHGDDAKLEEELHFSSLKCLAKWARKAALALPKLQKDAEGLHPRGDLYDETVPGLYV
jgi:hypothetical protein